MKQYVLRVLPIIMILGISIILNAPGTPSNSSNLVQNQLTNGSIAGIDYSYGTNTFYASGNFTHVEEGVISEVSNETSSAQRTLPLILDSQLSDVIVLVNAVELDLSANQSYIVSQERYNNDSYYGTYIDFVFNVMALRYDANATIGQQLMNIEFHENVTTEMSTVIDMNGNFLGQYPSAVHRLDYNFKYLNGTEVRRFDFIFNQIIIFEVLTQEFTVDITQTNFAFAYVGYYMRYSNEYNISATAHQVNITDGENFALGVSMFDEISANYTEFVATYIGYSFISYQVTQLKFTNGTDVPWEMYPRNLLPVSYTTQGYHIEVGYRESQTKLLSTFQNIASVFAAFNENVTENSVSLEANLAIWSIQTITTMAAYNDGNDNGRLDLSLDSDGLSVAPSDRVEYLGITEAYQTTTVNAHYKSNVYNESLQLYGLGVNITNTNVNNTLVNVNVYQEGYGDVNADTSSSFNWVEPIERDDGIVIFEFGVDYSNFPVTWLNVTDPANSVIDYENIGYHYLVAVDPQTGKAKISGTWTYGGVVNAQLKNAVDNLSLATILKSEFFAISASYTATQTDEELNQSRTKTFTSIGVRSGGGIAAEIGVDGPKQFYLANGINQTANFDAINILLVHASFEGERTTVFSSESENTAGLATVNGIKETFNVNLFYSASLIVISYPEWSGNDVVHDPDYNINYEPNKVVEESSSDPSEVSSTNGLNSSQDKNSDVAGLSFFNLTMGIQVILIIGWITKKKRSPN